MASAYNCANESNCKTITYPQWPLSRSSGKCHWHHNPHSLPVGPPTKMCCGTLLETQTLRVDGRAATSNNIGPCFKALATVRVCLGAGFALHSVFVLPYLLVFTFVSVNTPCCAPLLTQHYTTLTHSLPNAVMLPALSLCAWDVKSLIVCTYPLTLHLLPPTSWQ